MNWLPIATIWFIFTGSCGALRACESYVIMNYGRSVTTWESARVTCQSLDMELVVVSSPQEKDYLLNFLSVNNNMWKQEGWWIGGKLEDGEWKWVNDEPITFPDPSLNSGPMEYLAIVRHAQTDGGWSSYRWKALPAESGYKLGFICEKDTCS